MQAEQLEIMDFLRHHLPFSELSETLLAKVASQVEISYFKAGTQILTFGEPIDAFYVVRSGSVEISRRNGDLYNRLSEGGYFGEAGLLHKRGVRFPAKAIEDTLVYLVPEQIFHELFDASEGFADYVEVDDHIRLQQAVSRSEDANELLTARVDTLITREPPSLTVGATAAEAAEKMTAEQVSAILVIDPHGKYRTDENPEEEERPYLIGLVTESDIARRLVAARRTYDTPVTKIMSELPVCVEHHQFVFEASLTMLRHNIHHLPVLKRGKPVGILALSDIIRYESQNSLFVVRSIFEQTTLEGLQGIAGHARACFVRMVNEDANSHMIGSAMSIIGRSFKQRLLELGEEKFGAPPIPYCFLALGSMARDEQLIVTDQDNAMILDNRYDPDKHEEYFSNLAAFVSDGLAACGYTYCTGGIMATNPKWRQPLKVWEGYFTEWIDNPTPEFLLNSSIFFDLDGVWGELAWARKLNALIARKASSSKRFLACLARNALRRTPPLGFFKEFVVEKDGRHINSFNLKRRGTAPLADLIRVHALACGSRSINSFDRLEDIMETKLLPVGSALDIKHALEFIAMVRIRHQALDLQAGREPDNNVEPENLSDFERKTLKDAFQILSSSQKFLRFRYNANIPK